MDPVFPVLVGPTGVGKSETALALARALGAQILSADTYQAYRGLPIGTAQPSAEDQRSVPHHLVGCLGLEEKWDAAEFAKRAAAILKDLRTRGKDAVVVGGSGFYLKALTEGIPEGEAPDPDLRAWVAAEVERRGPEGSRQWLAERSPQAAARLHPNDRYRISRALEKSYGHPTPKPAPLVPPEWFRFYGLEMGREALDKRLRERASRMWRDGLLDETRTLLASKIPPDHPVWGAIGYREAAGFLDGSLTEGEALEKMFRRTRQYAKRQWTWFRRQAKAAWIDLERVGGPEGAARKILDDIQIKGPGKSAPGADHAAIPAEYQCRECGLHYSDPGTADQCEAWCKEHKSCNLEITRLSVERSPHR